MDGRLGRYLGRAVHAPVKPWHMGPFDRLKPGEFLSASQYNQLIARIEQFVNINVAPPLEISRSQSGYSIRLNQADPDTGVWARITSLDESGSGIGCPEPNGGGLSDEAAYFGYQIVSDKCTDPVESGLSFDNALPLIEITGNKYVRGGAIVRAFASGDHYSFLHPMPGAAVVRVISTFGNFGFYIGYVQELAGFDNQEIPQPKYRDGMEVYLFQRQGALLKTDGTGFYDSALDVQSFGTTINDYVIPPRPVYITAQYRALTHVECKRSDGTIEETLGP